MAKSRHTSALFIKNFIFGVEDSLVSTVGLLSGVAAANVPRSTIFLTGIILIFVEAFSMGVGSFLSEQSAEEYLNHADSKKSISITASLIMFFSYFAAGFIPLFPYIVFNTYSALFISIVFSLTALFLLGAISARLFKSNILKSAIRMLVMGGIAVAVGVVIGKAINNF